MSRKVGITHGQKTLHVASEAGAVFIAAPFLWWAADQTEDPTARDGLRLLAVATWAIDGYLLLRFMRKVKSC